MEVIEDITQEVLLALEPYGGAVHVHVDKHSTQGNVYVKSISIAQGEAAVNALHKRHFSGQRVVFYLLHLDGDFRRLADKQLNRNY